MFTRINMVKWRLQFNNIFYKGVWDYAQGVEEGFGTYRKMVLMNAPFTAVHFATYDTSKRSLKEILPECER